MISAGYALIAQSASPADDATAERLRRLLLRTSSPAARIHDLPHAANWALEVGLQDGASALYGLMFLKTGFGPAGAAVRSAIDARTELWRLPPTPTVPASRVFSVDAAVAELGPLLALATGTPPAWPDISFILDDTSVIKPPVSAHEQHRMLVTAADVAAILRDTPRLQMYGGLAEAFRSQAHAVLSSSRPQIEREVHQPLETLLTLFLLAQVREFLVNRWGLLFASSPQLFDAVSVLDPAALGPYLSNVRLILRDVDDLFGLIEAASNGPPAPELVETWSVLLSSAFEAGELLSLIDALADRGLVGALRAVLARLALSRQADRSLEVGWRLRDVAMDIGAFDLAFDAQRLAINWRPASGTEWMTLAELLQSRGANASAEAAYRRASALDANLISTDERLEELRTGVPRPLTKGFGTSRARHLLRRARLEAYKAVEEDVE